MNGPVRIANASGFYGDRFSAVREMLEGGPLDVLTGDYLAELTMLILGRERAADPRRGYARTFLRQMEECLGLALDKGVRIVSNAGGVNPAALAEALTSLAARLGVSVRIGYVEGDDLVERADELGLGAPLTANAYLGCWGIVECLRAGADVVITGRVTDAALTIGPAAAYHGWVRDDWDALAGATVAGHIIECGTQATGGNYAFFTEIDATRCGFPVAEVYRDGSCVVTKHRGTGGAVTVETVTAQLLYEIGDVRYPGPDVTTRLDSIELSVDGEDRVAVTGVRGEPPPGTAKVCLNRLGGYRNEMTFILTGLNIEAKADLARRQVEAALIDRPAEVRWQLARTDVRDAPSEEQASALLRCTVKDPDPVRVGRAFTGAAVELALASYPGFALVAPPAEGVAYGVYQPAYVDAATIEQFAVLPDGRRVPIPPAAGDDPTRVSGPEPVALPDRLAPCPTRTVPLGTVVGGRSGDKGGTANVGLWARSDDGWRWLAHALDVAEFRRLLPEADGLVVHRFLLPRLRAVNFVVDGLLGQGVASSTRFDPQAKGLAEFIRSRLVEIPEVLA